MTIPVHPIQLECCRQRGATAPTVVTMQAYEVYKHLYGEQSALVTDGCRGGFGLSELIAFLYAFPYPKSQWHARVDEAMTGLKLKGLSR